MVDTLYLETENFHLNSAEKFTIQGNYKQPEMNVLFSASDSPSKIMGISAYCTWAPANSHRTSIRFRISTNQFRKFLTIQIASLPRLVHLTNIYPLDNRAEYDAAIREIKTIAKEVGLEVFDWNELIITRMDITGTFITRRRASIYLDILKSSSLRGNQKVVRREGVEFHTQKSTYAFYDKAAQMKAIDEHLGDELLYLPNESRYQSYISTKSIRNHLLRAEFRFKEYSSIRKNFSSVTTLGQLLDNNDELYFKYFEVFSRVLDQMDGTSLIKNKKESRVDLTEEPSKKSKSASNATGKKATFNSKKRNYSVETVRSLIEQARKEHQKHWLSSMVMDFGYLYIAQTFGDDFNKKLREILTSDTEDTREKASSSQQALRFKENLKVAVERSAKYLNILAPATTYFADFEEFKKQIQRYLTTEYEEWRAKLLITDELGNERPYGYDVQLIELDPIKRSRSQAIFNDSAAQKLKELEDDFSNFPYMVRLKLPHGEADRLKRIKLSSKK